MADESPGKVPLVPRMGSRPVRAPGASTTTAGLEPRLKDRHKVTPDAPPAGKAKGAHESGSLSACPYRARAARRLRSNGRLCQLELELELISWSGPNCSTVFDGATCAPPCASAGRTVSASNVPRTNNPMIFRRGIIHSTPFPSSSSLTKGVDCPKGGRSRPVFPTDYLSDSLPAFAQTEIGAQTTDRGGLLFKSRSGARCSQRTFRRNSTASPKRLASPAFASTTCATPRLQFSRTPAWHRRSFSIGWATALRWTCTRTRCPAKTPQRSRRWNEC